MFLLSLSLHKVLLCLIITLPLLAGIFIFYDVVHPEPIILDLDFPKSAMWVYCIVLNASKFCLMEMKRRKEIMERDGLNFSFIPSPSIYVNHDMYFMSNILVCALRIFLDDVRGRLTGLATKASQRYQTTFTKPKINNNNNNLLKNSLRCKNILEILLF
jgi:hypothetical protein